MSQRPFSVPTIPHDLTREESIIQIATVLEYLDKTYNDIFAKIDSSIDGARSKIKTFDARIKLIDLKISKIKGSNKAIQICSSAKYPVNIVNDDIPTEIDDEDNFYEALKFNEYKQKLSGNAAKNVFNAASTSEMKRKMHKYASQYAPLDEISFKDKFQEYNVDKGRIYWVP